MSAIVVERGERFSSSVKLTLDKVTEFSHLAGDDNPLHHDAAFAATTRYGRPIASGTHTTALLLGLTATHFAKRGAVVGVEFSVRFRRPVYADETILLEWLVVRVTPHVKSNGLIVEMRGRAKTQAGLTAVGATGKVLVSDRL